MSELLGITAMAVVLTGFILWARAFRCLVRGQPIIPFQGACDVPWGLADLVMAIVAQMIFGIAAQLLLSAGTASASPDALTPQETADRMLVGGLATAGALVLTLVWLFARYRVSWCELGVSWRRFTADCAIGLGAFFMLAPIVYLVQYFATQLIPSEHPLIELLKKEPSNRFFAISTFSAVIVAPLTEEVFFRLLLQGWLVRLLGKSVNLHAVLLGGRTKPDGLLNQTPISQTPAEAVVDDGLQLEIRTPPRRFELLASRGAILVSSMIFAAAHLPHGSDPIPLFVLALGLGYLYHATQRIVPSIVLHMLLNGSTLLMLRAATL